MIVELSGFFFFFFFCCFFFGKGGGGGRCGGLWELNVCLAMFISDKLRNIYDENLGPCWGFLQMTGRALGIDVRNINKKLTLIMPSIFTVGKTSYIVL